MCKIYSIYFEYILHIVSHIYIQAHLKYIQTHPGATGEKLFPRSKILSTDRLARQRGVTHVFGEATGVVGVRDSLRLEAVFWRDGLFHIHKVNGRAEHA